MQATITGEKFNFKDFLDEYKTYIVIAASVIYGVGIDWHWWPHSLTLDALLGGGAFAAFRSAMKTNKNAIVDAVISVPPSPAALKAAAQVHQPEPLPVDTLTPSEEKTLAELQAKKDAAK